MDCGEGGRERSCHLQIINDDGIEFLSNVFLFLYEFICLTVDLCSV